MQARMQDVWKSYRSLPLWVQIWVALILAPVNAAAFFLFDTWLGVAAAIAAVFVALKNATIMWVCRGTSLSVPHLLASIPAADPLRRTPGSRFAGSRRVACWQLHANKEPSA